MLLLPLLTLLYMLNVIVTQKRDLVIIFVCYGFNAILFRVFLLLPLPLLFGFAVVVVTVLK